MDEEHPTAPIVEPIVMCVGEDCSFYRSSTATIDAGIPLDAKLFDASGQRLAPVNDQLVAASDGDGTAELARLLRDWLDYMDALRESTADWSLSLLVRASRDHLGYAG